MFDLYSAITHNPKYFRQLRCGKELLSFYNCPLEKKFEDTWTQHSYILYILDGRKVWHTVNGSYELRKGDCVFVRKGAAIVEQFLDTDFCIFLFFVSDDFICDVLKNKIITHSAHKKFEPIMKIDNDKLIQSFFSSMQPYFEALREPDQMLLELKFRELILTIADNSKNDQLIAYFRSLQNDPQVTSLERVMEENYCFNLKLEAYAQLSNRSLSAFKRDFQKIYNTTPGKWLLQKRMEHASYLLNYYPKQVSEVAFESGFENPSHFSRAFKEYFGYTPTAIKQSQVA